MSDRIEVDLIVQAVAEGFEKLRGEMSGAAEEAEKLGSTDSSEATEGIENLLAEIEKTKLEAARTREELQKAGEDGDESANMIAQGFSKAQIMVAAFAVAAVGALVAFAKKSIEAARDAGVISEVLDGWEERANRVEMIFGSRLLRRLDEFGRASGLTDAGAGFDEQLSAHETLDRALQMGIITGQEYGRIMKMGSVSVGALTDAAADLVPQIHAAERAQLAAAEAGRKHAEDTAFSAMVLAANLADLDLMVGGKLGKELESYDEKMGGLRDKAADLSTAIAELESRQYLSSAQQKELEGLREELGAVEGAMTKTADAHDEATNRILFNLLQQRLAMYNLGDAEYEIALAVAESMGIIDEATRETMANYDEVLGMLESGQISAAEAIELINGISAAAKEAQGTYTLTFDIRTIGNIPMPEQVAGTGLLAPKAPKVPEMRQYGGPVTAGSAYIVGERRPELFVPDQNGAILPNVPQGGGMSDERVISLLRGLPQDIAMAVSAAIAMREG